jgi:D-alanyl-lipoteichoic acid acyltransferase DltB (MBOAT superfamily)
MEFISKFYLNILEKATQSLNKREDLPLFFMFIGGVSIASAIGVDFFSFAYKGFGSLQITVAWAGFTIFAGGIIFDLAIGQRKLFTLDKQSFGKFLVVTIQFGFVVLVIRQFQLVNEPFYEQIMPLTFIGFLIHYFLPYRYRLSFFLVISLSGFMAVLGLINGAWLIGIGLIIIGICHLPIRFAARCGILIATGIFLAVLRADRINTDFPSAILPILGSMFMFRLIIYLYDLRHGKDRASISYTLSYFFLLPNVVFPLFPVVDYKNFCNTYYDDDRYHIYQKGVRWMFRGITHLILYRLVYYYMMIPPSDVSSFNDLVRYLISNFLLYLEVSGRFHLIVGILHLFGFNLPETNRFYYLASSFTDFWRRANIYWKDFMLKVFYYPTYFRLRKLGHTPALVLSIIFVFISTWLLHSYQWFWLRGSFLLQSTDVLFWTIFAMIMVINSLYEAKYGRKRTIKKHSSTPRSIVTLYLRTAGTFAAICILWSIWTSASLSEWFSLWSFAGVSQVGYKKLSPGFYIAAICVLSTIFVFIEIFRRRIVTGDNAVTGQRKVVFKKSIATTGVSIIILYVVGSPVVHSQFGLKAQEIIRDLKVSGLSKNDADQLRRGYYEDLINVDRFNSQLWKIYSKRPKNWKPLVKTEAARLTGDYYHVELMPSRRITFYGKPYSTNRWGMRDLNYELLPPPYTCRIAIIGSSHANGWGVSDNETFESLLEKRLNFENKREKYVRYEILNFAVGGYSAVRQLMLLENKVFSLKPDLIFFIQHPRADINKLNVNLTIAVKAEFEIPYEYLRDIVSQAGVHAKLSRIEISKRLKPFAEKIMSWAYRKMVNHCKAKGILPVGILLPPSLTGNSTTEDYAFLLRLAEDAGFIVLNLKDVYDGYDLKSLQAAEWDLAHPNAKGHRLIAERLFIALREKRELIPIGLFGQTAK